LLCISDREFSHQYSTNIGIAASEYEFVCITNAHSLPLSQSWLEDGLRWFKNKNIAGVSGFFYPKEVQKTIHTFSNILYYLIEKYVLKLRWCSTMNCIIRKSLWKEYPFDERLPLIIPETKKYGLEDFDWSLEMINRGFQIIIDPQFSIYHSHQEGVQEVTRNTKNYFIYKRIQKKIENLKRPRTSVSTVKDPIHFVRL
jgi:GT2 family glycosyltransferase